MKLSEDLEKWRAERPDEWTMDRFISRANDIEKALTKVREDINWMLNNRQFLNGWCFDYIEAALGDENDSNN